MRDLLSMRFLVNFFWSSFLFFCCGLVARETELIYGVMFVTDTQILFIMVVVISVAISSLMALVTYSLTVAPKLILVLLPQTFFMIGLGSVYPLLLTVCIWWIYASFFCAGVYLFMNVWKS